MTDKISRSDIVGVALDLLASGGLNALAMRRIASELGVQQSALYWHFENKQRLLAAVADQLLEPVSASDAGDWRVRVSALASRLRSELLAYPDGAELVATAIAFRLGAQLPFDQFAEEMSRGGVARERAEVAAAVLVHFILGYTNDEQQHDQAAALGAIDDPTSRQTSDRFDQGIALIVAGIEAQL